MVTPRIPPTVPTSVAVVSSLVSRYITIMASKGKWSLNIMIGTVAAVQASVRRSVACQRSGVNANSRRRKSYRPVVGHGDRARVLVLTIMTPLAVSRPGCLWGLVTYGHDCRGTNAEGVIRVVETDTHGKPLGETDPVELPVDLRQPHDARAAVGDHRPAQPHHGPVEVLMRLRLEVNIGGHSLADMLELRLAKVRDHIPGGDIHQRENVRAGAGKGALLDVQIHHMPTEGGIDATIGQVKCSFFHRHLGAAHPCVDIPALPHIILGAPAFGLGLLDRRDRGVALSPRGFHGCYRPGEPGACLLHAHGSDEPLRACLFDVILGDKLARQEWFNARELILSEFQFSLSPCERGLGCHPLRL